MCVSALQSQAELAIREAEAAAMLESLERDWEVLEERAQEVLDGETAGNAREEEMDGRQQQLEEMAQALQLVRTQQGPE
jgi:hypothetical protein